MDTRGRIARWAVGGVIVALLAGGAWAEQTVTRPFRGVEVIERLEAVPRVVRMHVVVVDLAAPGVRVMVTPPGGNLETVKQTTLAFLIEQRAQVAINAHFFEPWPAPQPDSGEADLVGLAASAGRVYSAFEASPPKPQAIRANAPALNIDANNRAAIVHRDPADASGMSLVESVTVFNVVSGNEQILTNGEVTAGTGTWHNTPNPRTVIGLAGATKLVVLVVDGRQPGRSEGLSVREAAELLRRDYGVSDALNLDGGGSSTLCLADPSPRVANVPVGVDNVPGTLRAVGSNLAIFAPPAGAAGRAPQGNTWAAVPVVLMVLAVAVLAGVAMRRRQRNPRGG